MGHVPHYPKIFSIGHDAIERLFIGEVEITEKVDGSLFGWGVDAQGQICIRSKSKPMYLESYEKMFQLAVEQVENKRYILEGMYKTHGPFFIYSEFLSKPKHNCICYSRTPKDNLIVFGWKIGQNFVKDHFRLKELADYVGLETVSLLYHGEFAGGYEKLKEIIYNTQSVLGNSLIEGVVVKNYGQICSIGAGTDPQFGKYVREDFKEKLHKEWRSISGKNALQEFIDGFKSEARFLKAIQHAKEDGKLENSPRDIGLLMKMIPEDIFEEESEFIKNELFKIFKDQIRRRAVCAFPDFYKDYLLKKQFEDKSDG